MRPIVTGSVVLCRAFTHCERWRVIRVYTRRFDADIGDRLCVIKPVGELRDGLGALTARLSDLERSINIKHSGGTESIAIVPRLDPRSVR